MTLYRCPMLILRSLRSIRPPVRHMRLVSFSRFYFISHFLFLLSRVPHFLSFPPPDLEQRRREAARAAPPPRPLPPPPLPLPLVSYPFFSPFSFPHSPRFSCCCCRVDPCPSFIAARWRGGSDSTSGLGMAWISRK